MPRITTYTDVVVRQTNKDRSGVIHPREWYNLMEQINLCIACGGKVTASTRYSTHREQYTITGEPLEYMTATLEWND